MGTARQNIETVVSRGYCVFPGEEGPADIGISGEKIVAVAEPGTLSGETYIDASGAIVMPGGIDPHTHINWPLAAGGRSRDTFESATRRAAQWGTTTVVDFVPPTKGSLLKAAEARLVEAESSVIDYSFHPIVTRINDETLREIPVLVDEGMGSFKVYTTYDHRLESADIRHFIRVLAEAGGLPGFHAEHHALVEDELKSTLGKGDVRAHAFPQSRPGHTEAASIREISGYALESGAPVYIYHVSGMDALHEIERGRAQGVDIRAETCAHYLTYDESVYSREDGWKFVITPPIRPDADRRGLWRAIAEKRLNAVASDHCAYGQCHKKGGFEDFTAMEPGAPGVASRFPLLWQYGVEEGRLSLRDFVNINSAGPAEALGLENKGRLSVGADADLVLWDREAAWSWGQDEASNNGTDYDIYEGLEGKGRPRLTLSRGRIVYQDGVVSENRRGAFVPSGFVGQQ